MRNGSVQDRMRRVASPALYARPWLAERRTAPTAGRVAFHLLAATHPVPPQIGSGALGSAAGVGGAQPISALYGSSDKGLSDGPRGYEVTTLATRRPRSMAAAPGATMLRALSASRHLGSISRPWRPRLISCTHR
jgi:hypothetical protein